MLRSTIVALVFVLVVTGQSIANQQSVKGTGIILGPAIINDCKFIQLWDLDQERLEAHCDTKKFVETRGWVVKNFWRNVNRDKAQSVAQSKYRLYLFNKLPRPADGNDTAFLLLDAPLNSETLGANYRQKIDELRAIMAAKEEDSAVPTSK